MYVLTVKEWCEIKINISGDVVLSPAPPPRLNAARGRTLSIAVTAVSMGATLPDWSGIPDFFHFGNPDSRFFFCSPDQFPIFLFSWSVPDFFRVVSVQS